MEERKVGAVGVVWCGVVGCGMVHCGVMRFGAVFCRVLVFVGVGFSGGDVGKAGILYRLSLS